MMVAVPGLTCTSLTKERTKALVSVNSLVLRNSLISLAKAAMVSALSSNSPPFCQHGPGFLGGGFQLLPAVAVFQDALRGVGHIQVGAFHDLPDAVQLPLDLFQLVLDGLQVLPLLPGHAVHFFVQHLHQVTDVSLGQDVLADIGDNDLLKTLGVEPGGVAGPAALLED